MPSEVIVVIGRDLGSRLARCLQSVVGLGPPVIYVDSASTDGSSGVARQQGVVVVELDPRTPMSASRGRNAGFRLALELFPSIEFVQFIDGDCALDKSWIDRARLAMHTSASVAVVCGHVRERDAEQSVAATLLDVDWRGPVGEIQACGGIFFTRVGAFSEVGGFSEELAFGEEADLCGRLIRHGWRLRRIDAAMCTHDAGIHTVSAWLRRAARVGFGDAKSASFVAPMQESAARERVRRSVFWALGLPAIGVLGVILSPWLSGALLVLPVLSGVYALQVLRVAARKRTEGHTAHVALQYAFFSLIAKWAHLAGYIRYWRRR